MPEWWNTNYNIRRNIKLVPSLTEDDRWAVVKFPPTKIGSANANNKYRKLDFEDIEVLKYDKNLESWSIVPRKIVDEVDIENQQIRKTIAFKLKSNLVEDDYSYYSYMNNLSLSGINFKRPSYLGNFFEVPGEERPYILEGDSNPSYDETLISSLTYEELDQVATPGGSYNFTVTRPKDHWSEGVSSTIGARANFQFFGEGYQFYVRKGPDRGIVKVELFTEGNLVETTEIDLYAHEYQEVAVATSSMEDFKGRDIRFTVTGQKNPSSAGFTVELTKVNYRGFVLGEMLSEELLNQENANRIIVGP